MENGDWFGETLPQNMPVYFFGGFGNGGAQLDYASAVKADVSKQNYSVAPRHWYIDATMRCADCDSLYLFSAAEQQVWYEEYGFYVDSIPRCCPACRRQRRLTKSLRQEYDRGIAAAVDGKDLTIKSRMVEVIDCLCELGEELSEAMHEHRKQLARQLAKTKDGS
jgi:hypothetical protein